MMGRMANRTLRALRLLAMAFFFQSAATAADDPREARLRIAVADFGATGVSETIAAFGPRLLDLVTAHLSGISTIELVERADLNKALGEISLLAGGLARPADAVKVGKL